MCNKKEQDGHALGVLGHDSAYTMWSTWMLPFLTHILTVLVVIGTTGMDPSATVQAPGVLDGFQNLLISTNACVVAFAALPMFSINLPKNAMPKLWLNLSDAKENNSKQHLNLFFVWKG